MGIHHTSNAPNPREAAVSDAAARVGDGAQLQPEDFAALNYAERTALKRANPDQYAALRDGHTAGSWRPGATVRGADL